MGRVYCCCRDLVERALGSRGVVPCVKAWGYAKRDELSLCVFQPRALCIPYPGAAVLQSVMSLAHRDARLVERTEGEIRIQQWHECDAGVYVRRRAPGPTARHFRRTSSN
eukprot:3119411-Pyramimonas_sp.AAC.1